MDVRPKELVRLAKVRKGIYYERFVASQLAEIMGAVLARGLDAEVDAFLLREARFLLIRWLSCSHP